MIRERRRRPSSDGHGYHARTSTQPVNDLERLEALYDSGHYRQAVALAESMLESGAPPSVARARYHLALCHLQLGHPDLAREHLDEARAYYEVAGDEERLVECMASEASYAVVTQAPDAIDVGNRALAACRALESCPAVLEVRILSVLASAHIAAGAWLDAIDAYEQAIELARPLFDMKRQARLLNDAALANKEIGRFEAAVHHITQAIALGEATREPVMLARAENNFGVILLAMHDPKSARPHLERSLLLCVQSGLESGRSHVLLSLAELCLEEGQPEPSRIFATQALELSGRLHEWDSCAQAHLWLGRVAASLGDTVACDREFAVALKVWEARGATEWLVRGHEVYAEILEKRGDITLANAELRSAVAMRARSSLNRAP